MTEDRGPIGYVYLPGEDTIGKRMVAHYVSGHCMEPTIAEGNIVVMNIDDSPAPRDIVVVKTNTGGILLGRFLSHDDGAIRLGHDNPAYGVYDLNGAQVVGVVTNVVIKMP